MIDPRSKVFAHLDRLAALQRGEIPAPISVEIDLSNRCNLGCEWCHFAYTHTRGPLAGKVQKPDGALDGGDLMLPALAYRMLGELKRAGIVAVIWTGGGEPTLHPEFDGIVLAASQMGLEQGIYTNGTMLSQERASHMRRCLTWAYVSLDECDADAYARSKGGGSQAFERACDGIARLASSAGDAAIGVGFLLHRENWHRTDEMIALARSLGATYTQFRPTILYDQHNPGNVAENTDWLSWAINALRGPWPPDVIVDAERFQAYRDWQGHGYDTCYFAALSTVITPNGRVWRCVNKREHLGALIGDLSVESFSEIWSRSGGPVAVDRDCRVMCRGHLANLTLDGVLREREHAAFI